MEACHLQDNIVEDSSRSCGDLSGGPVVLRIVQQLEVGAFVPPLMAFGQPDARLGGQEDNVGHEGYKDEASQHLQQAKTQRSCQAKQLRLKSA